jgi:DNA-binding transcriptional regulator PaaX
MSTEIVLDILRDLKWIATNVVFNDYHASYKNLRRYSRSGRPQRSKEGTKADLEKTERQRFHNLLYQLQKQGFVEKKKSEDKKTIWKLTSKGLGRLKILKNKKLLAPLKSIEEKKDYLKIIVFDIPENQKKKRDWLRNTLVNFNFSLLQKSVWTGDSQLPEEFFHFLKELNLLPYVHIFAVNKEKQGTLNIKS